MAKIVIRNLSGKSIEVVDTKKPLLKHFQDNYLDWMHACGGKGRCTTCKVIIESGAENMSRITPAEERYSKLGQLAQNERLACQVRVLGDVTISVPEDCKLPHIRYSD